MYRGAWRHWMRFFNNLDMKELYINGFLVDIAGQDIVLAWKTNIITAPDKIHGSNSYTVTLPRTARNDAAFGMAAIAGVVATSDSVRKYLPFSYVIDGCEVCSGRAAVLDVAGDAIAVTLHWNVQSAIVSLAAKGWSLRDLRYEWTQIGWYKGVPVSDYEDGMGVGVAWARYGLEFDPTGEFKWVHGTWHPAVAVGFILTLMCRKLGLPETVDYMRMFPDLYIPALTEDETPERIADCTLTGMGGGLSGTQAFLFTINPYNDLYLTADNVPGAQTAFHVRNPANESVVKGLRVSGFFLMQIQGDYTGDGFDVYMMQDVGIGTANDKYLASFGTAAKTGIEGLYRIEFERVGVDLSGVEDGEPLYIVPALPATVTSVTLQPSSTLKMEPIVGRLPMVAESVWDGDVWYNYIYNLPDIGCIEFIKALCAMFGAYVKPDSDTLDFGFYQDITTEDSIDWSRRLMWHETRKMSFKWGDFAQCNYFRYKDKDVEWANPDGAMVVEDETLADSKDYYTFPFVWPDGDRIPIYSKDEDSNAYTLEDAGPYIMHGQPVTLSEGSAPASMVGEGKFGLTPLGLEWWRLLPKHHAEYQRWVRRPVVMEAKLLLDGIDLKEVRTDRLYYCAQTGRYYFLLELTAGGDGRCSAKFLEYKV